MVDLSTENGVSGNGAVELTSLATGVPVDLSTEMVEVVSSQSRDGVSVTIAVELARLATVVVVDTTVAVSDTSTETALVV